MKRIYANNFIGVFVDDQGNVEVRNGINSTVKVNQETGKISVGGTRSTDGWAPPSVPVIEIEPVFLDNRLLVTISNYKRKLWPIKKGIIRFFVTK